jgi:hypothetical protein
MNIQDKYGNLIGELDKIGGETVTDPRTDIFTLQALGAEKIIELTGEATAILNITNAFTGVFAVDYSPNGNDWYNLPLFNLTTESLQATAIAIGNFHLDIPVGTKKIRVKVVTTITVGTPQLCFRAGKGTDFITIKKIPATKHSKIAGAVNTATTLSLPAVASLHHYITGIKIQVYASVATTGNGTSAVITTTNMNGAREYRIPTKTAPIGEFLYEIKETFSTPLKSANVGVATSIVAPAIPNCQVFMCADYYEGL